MNDITAPTLASSAMLIELNIGVWTAFKLDRAVTNEVNTSKHANHGAARVNKNLLQNVPELEAIKQLARQTRLWLYANTLPWSDSGPRLLPTEAFFDFKQEINNIEAEFDRLVATFVMVYPTLISNQAFKLGSMFSRDDYPTQWEVADKFFFHTSFTPLPQAGDFRVDIGNEALVELETQYEEQYVERFDAAVQDVKQRLLDGLAHLSERLEYEEGGKMKVFRDTALSNVTEMLKQVKVLNISNDEALEAAGQQAEQVLSWVSPKELRKDEDARDDTKRKLDDILAKFAV